MWQGILAEHSEVYVICDSFPGLRYLHKAGTENRAMPNEQPTITTVKIEQIILLIRGENVMLDSDLAALYGVTTKALIQAVKRNLSRFPEDFMFRLTAEEFANMRSQFVTSSSEEGWGGRRYSPYVFTEQGVAMLSSVLKSQRAIQVNIEIMRAFVRMRQMMASHEELARRLDELERKYDVRFRVVFDALRKLMRPPETKSRRVGFRV